MCGPNAWSLACPRAAPPRRGRKAPEQTLATRRAFAAARRDEVEKFGIAKRLPRAVAAGDDERIERGALSHARRCIEAPEELATAPADLASVVSAIGAGAIAPRDLERGDRPGGVEQLEVLEDQEGDLGGHGGHGRIRGNLVIYARQLGRAGRASNRPERRHGRSPFVIVEALYPGLTQLDFTGPHTIFSRIPGAGSSSPRARRADRERRRADLRRHEARSRTSRVATCCSSPAAWRRPT